IVSGANVEGTGTTAGVSLHWDVTADVAAFQADPTSNFGWLIKDAQESGGGVEFKFASDETGTLVKRPTLVVTYAPCLSILTPTTAPTWSTSASVISLGGNTLDEKGAPTGAASVSWTNAATATGGPASGTDTWQASNVPLRPGPNAITIKAADALGNQTTTTITVTSDVAPTITTQPASQ